MRLTMASESWRTGMGDSFNVNVARIAHWRNRAAVPADRSHWRCKRNHAAAGAGAT